VTLPEPLFNTAWEAAEWRKARIRELEAALRALTAEAPSYDDWEGEMACAYCHQWVGAHAEDCPWVRAKSLLGDNEPDVDGTSAAPSA
jgi:hypothetical protein